MKEALASCASQMSEGSSEARSQAPSKGTAEDSEVPPPAHASPAGAAGTHRAAVQCHCQPRAPCRPCQQHRGALSLPCTAECSEGSPGATAAAPTPGAAQTELWPCCSHAALLQHCRSVQHPGTAVCPHCSLALLPGSRDSVTHPGDKGTMHQTQRGQQLPGNHSLSQRPRWGLALQPSPFPHLPAHEHPTILSQGCAALKRKVLALFCQPDTNCKVSSLKGSLRRQSRQENVT